MAAKRPVKSRKPAGFIKPFPLALTAALAWAMLHQPPGFSPPAAGSWALEALAIGLATRAALALLLPGVPVCMALARRAQLHAQQDTPQA